MLLKSFSKLFFLFRSISFLISDQIFSSRVSGTLLMLTGEEVEGFIDYRNWDRNPEKIAFCGLYCGACRQYLKEKCPGCRKNEKAKYL